MEQWRANYRPSLIIERVLANCYFNLRTESKLSVHGTSINSEFDMSTNRPLNGNGKDYHAESFERILSSSIFENSRPGERYVEDRFFRISVQEGEDRFERVWTRIRIPRFQKIYSSLFPTEE